MKICDFCSTAKILMDFIGESKNINQIDFMYELFKDFMESDEAKDFDFDNGLVCRWLNGTAKLSPKITAYYSALGNLEAMAIDIEENILPLFYDKDMAVTELYDLLMSDTTVSETKKQSLRRLSSAHGNLYGPCHGTELQYGGLGLPCGNHGLCDGRNCNAGSV